MPGLDLRLRSSSYLFLAVVVAQLVLDLRAGHDPLGYADPPGRGVRDGGRGAARGRRCRGRRHRPLDRLLRSARAARRERAAGSRAGQARIALQQERALAERSRNLERLLDIRARRSVDTTAADVIAAAASPEFRTDHDRQGHAGGAPSRHGGDRAGGRRRAHHRPERARRQGAAADRPECGRGGAHRTHARTGRRGRHRGRPAAARVRERVGRNPDRRHGDHVRDRRDLPEGLRHRPRGKGRTQRRRVRRDSS